MNAINKDYNKPVELSRRQLYKLDPHPFLMQTSSLYNTVRSISGWCIIQNSKSLIITFIQINLKTYRHEKSQCAWNGIF